jgi:hypothetical protein
MLTAIMALASSMGIDCQQRDGPRLGRSAFPALSHPTFRLTSIQPSLISLRIKPGSSSLKVTTLAPAAYSAPTSRPDGAWPCRSDKMDLRDLGVCLIIMSIPFFIIAIFVFPLFIVWPMGGPCDKSFNNIANLSGLDFDIEGLSCHTSSIRVFVFRTGSNSKDDILDFEPVLTDPNNVFVIPSIEVNGGQIVISIERTGAISRRATKWHDYTINYRIGHDNAGN